jgi:hypothetical protein
VERYRALIAAAVLGLAGPGCIHIHLDGETKDKLPSEVWSSTSGAKPTPDGGVRQASAVVPAIPASLPKMLGKVGGAKGQAVEMSATWQNRIAFLPDPTRGGAMKPGIVGQLFLFGPTMRVATPEGPLTVELYDETPRPGRPADSVWLGRWTYQKEQLRQLKITDERFGECYAVFLPWPDYRPEIARVRLTVKYEPEGGFPIYATPSTMTIDTSAPGSGVSQPVVTTVVPGLQGGFGQMSAPMSPIGGPPPANFPAGGTSYASPAGGTLPPPSVYVVQPNGPQPPTGAVAPPPMPIPSPVNGTGATAPPPGLQPIVITAAQRR